MSSPTLITVLQGRVSTTGKSQGKPGKVREKYYFWKSQGKQGENALDREKSGKIFMNFVDEKKW